MRRDVLIRGAQVFDGLGSRPIEADIAIAGDRITAVEQCATRTAHRVIDGRGLAAAPGFLDIHGHSDYHLLLTPTAESAVLQGVTSEVGGNCGYAAAPIWGGWLSDRAAQYRDLYGLDHEWSTLDRYFDRLMDVGISMNFGLLAGHNTLRGSTMGGADRAATPDELGAMAGALERAMDAGALGLSSGLIYSPACFAPPEELTALAAVAGRKGGILTTHIRSEGDALLEAVEEVIAAAEQTGTPLQISHLKTYGQRNWFKLDAVLRAIESARARGVDVTADRYPYVAANTGLQAVLPKWALEGDRTAQTNRLQAPAVRARLRDEIGSGPAAPPWDEIMISEVTRPEHRVYEGLTVAAAARHHQQDPLDFTLDLLHAEAVRVDAIFFAMSEENLRSILQKPYVMIGSDSGCRAHHGPLSGGRPHPRTFGTFARALGQYVRESKLFELPTAIRKMTSDPCRRAGLLDRGVLRPGYKADVVLFDPDRVRDRATYRDPVAYPEGIHTVFVNGVITVEAGQHTGARAGQVLRRALQARRV